MSRVPIDDDNTRFGQTPTGECTDVVCIASWCLHRGEYDESFDRLWQWSLDILATKGHGVPDE